MKIKVPLWLFLLFVIPLSVVLFPLLYFHFVSNPLPWPDWGNAGFVLPSEKHRQDVVDVLRHFGLKPDYRVDTDDVSRAIYRSKWPFILDVTSEEAAARVGNPESFIAIAVDDPGAAAEWAAQAFRERGHTAEAVHDADPGLEPGKLSVVTSSVMPGKMLVFRRTIMNMGPKPPAWQDDP